MTAGIRRRCASSYPPAGADSPSFSGAWQGIELSQDRFQSAKRVVRRTIPMLGNNDYSEGRAGRMGAPEGAVSEGGMHAAHPMCLIPTLGEEIASASICMAARPPRHPDTQRGGSSGRMGCQKPPPPSIASLVVNRQATLLRLGSLYFLTMIRRVAQKVLSGNNYPRI